MPAESNNSDEVDPALAARAGSGSHRALEELVRRHQCTAWALAVGMVTDRHEAQHLLEKALITAWRALPHVDDRAGALGARRPDHVPAFPFWLHGIVLDECLSCLRRRGSSPRPEDTLTLAAAVRVDQVVGQGARADAVHRAVGRLPVDQRAAVVLTTFAGHSDEEAAPLLGTTAEAVRRRSARGRRALLATLGGRA